MTAVALRLFITRCTLLQACRHLNVHCCKDCHVCLKVARSGTWVVLGFGRPEGMPRASSSAELTEAAGAALARLRGGRSACAMIFSSRTICAARANFRYGMSQANIFAARTQQLDAQLEHLFQQPDDQILRRHALHRGLSCIISESRGSNYAGRPMHETCLAAPNCRHGNAVYGSWHALSNKAYEAKLYIARKQTNSGNTPRQSRGDPRGPHASSTP